MDVIPLDASLVKGSHGRIDVNDSEKAIFIGNGESERTISPTSICDSLLSQIFD